MAIPNQITLERGTPCVHCRHEYDHRIQNTYPNGNRRVICGRCGRPFIIRRPRPQVAAEIAPALAPSRPLEEAAVVKKPRRKRGEAQPAPASDGLIHSLDCGYHIAKLCDCGAWAGRKTDRKTLAKAGKPVE